MSALAISRGMSGGVRLESRAGAILMPKCGHITQQEGSWATQHGGSGNVLSGADARPGVSLCGGSVSPGRQSLACEPIGGEGSCGTPGRQHTTPRPRKRDPSHSVYLYGTYPILVNFLSIGAVTGTRSRKSGRPWPPTPTGSPFDRNSHETKGIGSNSRASRTDSRLLM